MLEGLTFSRNFPMPYQMGINAAGSISDSNSLAAMVSTGGFEKFGFGDKVVIDFAATNAFGFWLITNAGFNFRDNDVNVTFDKAMSQLTVETVLFFQEIPGNKALV